MYTNYRKNQFEYFLKNFNYLYKTNILLISSNRSVTIDFLKSSWLSGFTDAEGCFTISLIKRTENYTQVQVRFILSQKQEYKFFEELSLIINGKVHYLKSYDEHNLTVNLTKLKVIIKYFSLHPLKTKKKIDYLNWLKVYYMVINKEHLISEKLEKIKKLKKKINQVKI